MRAMRNPLLADDLEIGVLMGKYFPEFKRDRSTFLGDISYGEWTEHGAALLLVRRLAKRVAELERATPNPNQAGEERKS